MPASDTRRRAASYRDVFGWSIAGFDSDRPSFDDASGLLSGAWISDHLPAAEPGLLPYIYVADIEQTDALIVAHAGLIVTEPFPEGKRCRPDVHTNGFNDFRWLNRLSPGEFARQATRRER